MFGSGKKKLKQKLKKHPRKKEVKAVAKLLVEEAHRKATQHPQDQCVFITYKNEHCDDHFAQLRMEIVGLAPRYRLQAVARVGDDNRQYFVRI